MSLPFIFTIVVILLILFFLVGMPITFALMAVSVIGLTAFEGFSSIAALPSAMFGVARLDIYLAIILFVFMARLLEVSGIGGELFTMVYRWAGRMRGSLLIAVIIASAILSALTGIGTTCVIAIGILAFPEMEKRGYSRSLSLGAIPFGGCLGPLIPPSIIMIILGGMSGLSIGKLFIGGIIPGVVAAVLGCAYVWIRATMNPQLAPVFEEKISWGQKLRELWILLPVLVLIAAIMGSIYGGIATPTEAGCVGAVCSFLYCIIRRKLTWNSMRNTAVGTVKTSTFVFFLLIGGACFATMLNTLAITGFIKEILTGLTISPIFIVILLQFVGLVMGMFMDGGAIMVITLPVFVPIIVALGVDPLWFGLLYAINMIIGYITPPFGMMMFVTKGIVSPDVKMSDIYRSSLPFVGILLLVMLIGFIFPQFLVWLPMKMG